MYNMTSNTEDVLFRAILALSAAVDAKDRYTSGHSRRVAEYSKRIAARMGKSIEEQELIYFAGLLHDIGKIHISDAIINKPGKLDNDEFEIIKTHPSAGFHIIKGISPDPIFRDGVKFHHERYDGKGYPNGLMGENIPEVARIMAVADAYDAMASNRSYRKALPQEVVRGEIEKGRGTQFDPDIANVMLELIDEDTAYTMCQKDDPVKNVLVVDDEPMNLKMVEFIFRDEPLYNIMTARSGQDALDIIASRDVDLVLLDIEMPGMDGFETFVKIREISEVPVAYVTANKELETIERATKLGVEDYLTKPFIPKVLTEVLHSLLY